MPEERRKCDNGDCPNVRHICAKIQREREIMQSDIDSLKDETEKRATKEHLKGTEKFLGGRITFTQVLYGGVIGVVLLVGGTILGFSNGVAKDLAFHEKVATEKHTHMQTEIHTFKGWAVKQDIVNGKILEKLEKIHGIQMQQTTRIQNIEDRL